MMRVCFDNNILIWGVRKKASPGQEALIRSAGALFEELDKNGAKIIIPTPVLSEFLTFAPEHRHAEITASLESHFQLTPFDAFAAATAARIWRAFSEGNTAWKDELKEAVPGITKARIKYDIQILATAISRSADILYTHDVGLKKLAGGRIEVRELPPPPPEQSDLFADHRQS